MKQVTTGRKVVTLALVVVMLAGPNTYGGTTTLNGGTLSLVSYYSEDEWAVAGDSTINSTLNFPSFLNGPLTGSSTLTHTGYFGGQLSLVSNAGNTFNGNIIVDSGTLRIAGSPFAAKRRLHRPKHDFRATRSPSIAPGP
jgi:autotransporter-associated beta strand protein